MADKSLLRPLVAALLGTLLVAATVLGAYHLGKDCGAWEAKRRLRGESPPILCFDGDGDSGSWRRARPSKR
jgi:hypothetical protein